MKKILLLFISITSGCLLFSSVNAQKKIKAAAPLTTVQSPPRVDFSPPGTTADCDTIDYPVLSTWSGTTYLYSNNGGFLNGTNGYFDMQKGNAYDFGDVDANYITGALVAFGKANSTTAANLNKQVYFRVYDDDGGVPGNLLATTQKALSEIKNDVSGGYFTVVEFDNPVPVPASRKFYLSVDIRNFRWNPTGSKDSIWVAGTRDDAFSGNYWNQSVPGRAWEQWGPAGSSDTSWYAFYDVYNAFDNDPNGTFNITFWIFPTVSATEAGCLLPISFLNFNGNIKNNQAVLSWATGTEINNKGFYIERSSDGKNFSSIDFVAGAGSSTAVKNYTYTDTKMSELKSATVYYRLKQMDLNGKISYSGILALKAGSVTQFNVYPNPVTTNSWVQFNTNEDARVNIKVIASDGRVLQNIDKGTLQAGTYTIPFDMAKASKGVYFIKLTVGDKTYTQTISK